MSAVPHTSGYCDGACAPVARDASVAAAAILRTANQPMDDAALAG